MKFSALVASVMVASAALTGCSGLQTDAAQGVGAKTCEILTSVQGGVKDFSSSAGDTTVGELKTTVADINTKLADAKKDASGLAAALINSVQAVFSGASKTLTSAPDDKKLSDLGSGFQAAQQNVGKVFDEAMTKMKCS